MAPSSPRKSGGSPRNSGANGTPQRRSSVTGEDAEVVTPLQQPSTERKRRKSALAMLEDDAAKAAAASHAIQAQAASPLDCWAGIWSCLTMGLCKQDAALLENTLLDKGTPIKSQHRSTLGLTPTKK